MPPLPPLFSPFSGFWRNAESLGRGDEKLFLAGLSEPVNVVYDKRGVPHVFAQNAHDLFFAQGYVTARDRLWQMEVQALAAAGRLAEILGPGLLEHDRFQRRLGIPKAAAASLELMDKEPESAAACRAYADGVNAWIAALDPEDYPLEYKLLDYAPGRWRPLFTALMIKNMQWTLAGGGDDLPLSETRSRLGDDFISRFFPLREPGVPPIFPAETAWDTSGPAPAGTTDSGTRPPSPALLPFGGNTGPGGPDSSLRRPDGRPPPAGPSLPGRDPDPGNGSNNFVLAGARTATGRPLLANDPHLNLGLPSLWYEIQLSAPGVSVYGVSLPGAPAVILGFNRKIAWGMTNGGDDVLDWYRVAFRDSTLGEYLYNGKWERTRREVEAIKVRGGATVLDTVPYTRQGPVVLKDQERPFTRNTPALHALRWLALDPSNELLAFLRLMRASDFAGFSAALESFHCPSQNFAFASTDGDIALLHHGRFPRKWKGQGRFPLNAASPGDEWAGWLPTRLEPSSRNPARHWLASANQSPADSTYPFYLGADYLDGPRARRLTGLVEAADSLDIDGAFAVMQDDFDVTAADLLPELSSLLAKSPLSGEDSAAWRSLAEWDRRHGPGSRAAALFDRWWGLLYHSIWSDEFGGDSTRYQWPSLVRTARMIREEPDADWYDDVGTPARETLAGLALRTFREARADLRGRPGGPPDWAAYRPVEIPHLAHIGPFGISGLRAGGCADCVNALKSSHGPSWRMAVDLAGEPRGYGIYPGGQSGNPGSPHYSDFVEDWAAGRHYPLAFYASPGSAGKDAAYRLRMRGP
jgi:penicillin amidase